MICMYGVAKCQGTGTWLSENCSIVGVCISAAGRRTRYVNQYIDSITVLSETMTTTTTTNGVPVLELADLHSLALGARLSTKTRARLAKRVVNSLTSSHVSQWAESSHTANRLYEGR